MNTVRPGRNRWRRHLTIASLLVGMTPALVGFAPSASAKPAPPRTDSCSGSWCGPCPQGVTWHKFLITMLETYVYTVRSATPTFFASDARQITNGLDTPITVTVTSQTSRTYTVTTTVGYSVDLFNEFHESVSASIVSSTTTAIGVSVQATVPPHSGILAEYGMHGYNIVYDATRYITSSSDLRNNVCGNAGTQYNLTAIGPTLVQGWRISPV